MGTLRSLPPLPLTCSLAALLNHVGQLFGAFFRGGTHMGNPLQHNRIDVDGCAPVTRAELLRRLAPIRFKRLTSAFPCRAVLPCSTSPSNGDPVVTGPLGHRLPRVVAGAHDTRFVTVTELPRLGVSASPRAGARCAHCARVELGKLKLQARRHRRRVVAAGPDMDVSRCPAYRQSNPSTVPTNYRRGSP